MLVSRQKHRVRVDISQAYTRNAHAHILPRACQQTRVNSPTEAARARALLTAREASRLPYESARTAEITFLSVTSAPRN